MELVLRPVDDRFFHEQVMPFLSLAMSDSVHALVSLREQLADAETRLRCERLLSSHQGGGLSGVEQEPWAELVERLLFLPWAPGPEGWAVVSPRQGYAGDWDEALHLSLMLEDPTYPYGDARASHGRREGFRLHPGPDLGLASLLGGQWEPFPSFPPDRVVSTLGRGEYVPREQYAFADWAWRPARTVADWNVHLERKLRRLLEREKARLAPVELPELEQVLAYWLGQVSQPPALSAAFSGLGPRASSWVQALGVLTSHVRQAAHEGAGLVIRVVSAQR
ncbi:hypothetical protein F0U60_09135 [Archangium minus]|uniref:Uncharacterized protein n=1 Tax=Archangium minus TaxID=83450 RepID=A0ABY9WK84_9BACT|nr:hypothetical protein F0U60_09135 [Archangium minus]